MDYQIVIDDFIGEWGYSKQYVRSALAGYRNRHVDVKISSYGGDLAHGLDIRQQLLDHGDVTVFLSGFVASAATVIAMGAKRVVMSRYGMFLVHKCASFIDAWGHYNADEMAQLIEQLEADKRENDKIDVQLAQMYAARCGKNVADILDILTEGRWLSAQEALALGFVDEIVDMPGEAKLNYTPGVVAKFNAMGLSTVGLQACLQGEAPEPAGASAAPEAPADNPTPTNPPQDMTHDFTAAAALLGVEAITADAEGYVSVTAGQFAAISAQLAAGAAHEAAIAERDATITALQQQVEALKNAPGDETGQIEAEAEAQFSAHDMYNSIKNIL